MLIEISRSILVFAHLMLFSGAIALVLWTDFSIIKNGVSAPLLHIVARSVLTLFLLLWITGLLIVFIDTDFRIAPIASNSKVLIKLVCVFVLTLNGVILHIIGLKTLTLKDRMRRSQAVFLCNIGALSTTNWLLAGFIGSANLLVDYSFQILLLLYIVVIVMCCLCGCLLSGFVLRRLNWHRARKALDGLGIEPVSSPAPLVSLLPFRQLANSCS